MLTFTDRTASCAINGRGEEREHYPRLSNPQNSTQYQHYQLA